MYISSARPVISPLCVWSEINLYEKTETKLVVNSKRQKIHVATYMCVYGGCFLVSGSGS